MTDRPEHSDPREPRIADAGPFAGVQGRHSVDYLLSDAQSQLVALGSQADFKASVMITASALITSVAASQLDDHDLGWPAGVLMVMLLPALLTSVLAVFPKFRTHREGDTLPDDFNALFFGHYAGISKERYLEEVAAIVRDDGAVYRSIAADIYDQGVYLVQAKYRYLRVSYTCFLGAFVAAAIALVVTELVG